MLSIFFEVSFYQGVYQETLEGVLVPGCRGPMASPWHFLPAPPNGTLDPIPVASTKGPVWPDWPSDGCGPLASI